MQHVIYKVAQFVDLTLMHIISVTHFYELLIEARVIYREWKVFVSRSVLMYVFSQANWKCLTRMCHCKYQLLLLESIFISKFEKQKYTE